MDRIDRRTYLRVLVAGAVGIAGCSGDDGARSARTRTPDTSGDAYRSGLVPDQPPTASDRQDDPATDGEVTQTEPRTVPVGERVSRGAVDVVVGDVSLVEDVTLADGEVLEAQDGTTFAVVDLSIQHVGERGVVDVGEVLSVSLRDATGSTVDPLAGVDPTPRQLTAGRLAPGEVVRGDLVYAVDDGRELVVALDSPTTETPVVVDTTLRRPADASTRFVQHVSPVYEFSRPVALAGVEVRLERLERGNALGGFLQSDEGHEAVVVGVTVENRGGRDRTLAPGQMELKDETGRLLPKIPTVVGALDGLDGEGVAVTDGGEQDGEIAYQVEERPSTLYWVFDFGPWGENRRVFWRIR